MIASIHGKITRIDEGSLVLDVHGLGFHIHVPEGLPLTVRRGEALTLSTYLAVREDSLTLYGFLTQEEVDLFSLLLRVNGVGPRLALQMLSTHTPEVIKRAVVQKQEAVFAQVSGIGSKTAQKIILSLEDRIPERASFEGLGAASELNTEVQEALVALGYSVVEAQTALQSLPEDAPENLEERLTMALQYFS
jgi:Holliday junction DNA helicase RuvA